jgi:hypothetical protein
MDMYKDGELEWRVHCRITAVSAYTVNMQTISRDTIIRYDKGTLHPLWEKVTIQVISEKDWKEGQNKF